jgi:iron complex outermembrane recepter protein
MGKGKWLAGPMAALLAASAMADENQGWADLSLQDLMNVKVESVSRKQQALSDSPAAVYVITADDIRRSGALSLPEVLRLAPGVEVARISNNKWAVSIRGFNGRMANKLLVLVDGRSIYSSLYGGVLWETEDMPLSEIERIEVIRGAAGVAWGSNAVNGVVNIITRRAQDTSGWLVDTHAGTSTGKASGVLRYGAKMEDGSAFRVVINDQKRDGGKDLNGSYAQDQLNDSSLSFRYDRPEGAARRWFASGRIYDTDGGEPWLIPTFGTPYNAALYGATRLVPSNQNASGANLLGRLEEVTDAGGEVRIQAYVDQFKGTVPALTDERNTVDLEAQHHFILGTDHDIVWGGNYRRNRHKETLSTVGFLTAQQSDFTINLASLFAQDEWTIVPKKFSIQAGLRVEHQTYGGTVPEPSLKGLWHLDERNTLWAGWSKTVRFPSVVEEDFGANPQAIPSFSIPGLYTGPLLIHVDPGSQSGFGNEKVRTVELGYRGQQTPTLSTDLVAYISHYDGIFWIFPDGVMTATTTGTPFPADPACAAAYAAYGAAPGLGLCQNLGRGNYLQVRTRGIELTTEWRPLSYWRLQLNASRMWLDGGSIQTSSLVYGSSPKYQGSLRSSVDIGESQKFDFWWRRIGGLEGHGNAAWPVATAPIAARTELDLRYAVQMDRSLEVSLTAQDLMSNQQLQFYADYMPNLPVIPQRAVYLQAVWRSL